MKHARADYDRIQDPSNLIPDHEPVFLLRGKDVCAPAAIEAWCKEAGKYGVSAEMISVASNHADYMRAWQIEHESQVPDMPTAEPGLTDDEQPDPIQPSSSVDSAYDHR